MQLNIQKHQRGVSAVELLVGISILAIMFIAVSFTITQFLSSSRDIADKTQALYLAEEGLEMMRFIRDKQWNYLSDLDDGNKYYLAISGSDVGTTTTKETIGIFTRSIRVTGVDRNGSDDIVQSGTDDPDSKYVTAIVTWGNPTSTVSLTTMLADIQNP